MKLQLLFLLPILAFLSAQAEEPFTYKDQRLSLQTGYRQDKLDWTFYSNRDFLSEKIKNFHYLDIGPSYRYVNEEKIYLLSQVIVGLGKSTDASLAINRQEGLQPASFSGSFKGKAYGVNVDSLFHIGYPIRLGPILIIGHTGLNHLYEKIDRKKPKHIHDENATFRARKYTYMNWINPLVGVELVLLPSNTGRYQFSAGYRFRFGRVKLVSKYSLEEETFNQKEHASLHTDSRVHILNLKASYGFTDSFLLEGIFGYEYWKGRKTNFDYSYKGYQNGNSGYFNYKAPYRFKGFKRQAFLGRLGFTLQF